VPGGSSGGSAAAVAADEIIYALGSDTGGSIRQPAGFCGVVGIKPTYGRVSRYGLMAMTSSLDQIGPLAKNVEDAAEILRIIEGIDEKDSTSAPLAFRLPAAKEILEGVDEEKPFEGIKIGVPNEYFAEGIAPEVERAIRQAIIKMESLGAEVSAVSLSHSQYALACYYIIVPSEVSANLARYDGIKYGMSQIANGKSQDLMDVYLKTRGEYLGKEVRRRIILGTYALSAGYYDAYYLRAQKVRTLVKQDFERAFEKVDILVAPTSPTTAFKIGEKADDPLQMYLADIYTVPINLAGIPALSMPCGVDKNGLPIGLQIIGKHFDEKNIIKAGLIYEKYANN